MSYREALKFFDLEDTYTEKELKKKYYKLAKNNHPDQHEGIDDEIMKRINGLYSILENELKKRKLKEFIEEWQLNINKLKDKYQNTAIYDFCLREEMKLDKVSSIVDAEKLKQDFDNRIGKLKESIVLPIEKNKLIKKVGKYLTGYSVNIKKLVNDYIILTQNANSLGEVNTLNQKFDIKIHEELIKEKERVNEYKTLKDNLRVRLIYKWYDYVTYNTNNILVSHDLLITSLAILNLSTIENINEISVMLDNINYNNLKQELTSFKNYYSRLTNNSSSILKNDTLVHDVNLNIDEQLLDIVLNKYYLYATNKSTKLEKLITNGHIFKENIMLLNKLDEEKYDIVLKSIKDESFNIINMVLNSIDNFYDPSKLYIERETGEIVIIRQNNKKIYTMYLDGRLKNVIENERDIIWKYMPLMKFFMIADFTYSKEVDEVSYNDVIMLSDYDTNFLYYTNELLLSYIDSNEIQEFKFIPAIKGYNFKLSDSNQITRNDYFKKYKDKDKCLMDLLLYIKKVQERKVEEKTL